MQKQQHTMLRLSVIVGETFHRNNMKLFLHFQNILHQKLPKVLCVGEKNNFA